MAIGFVSVTLGVLQLSSWALHACTFWMEKASFMLVALLGLWLSVRALKRLWAAITHARHANKPKFSVFTCQPQRRVCYRSRRYSP